MKNNRSVLTAYSAWHHLLMYPTAEEAIGLLSHSYRLTADCLSIKLRQNHQTSVTTVHVASYDIFMMTCERQPVAERTRRMDMKQIKTQEEARKREICQCWSHEGRKQRKTQQEIK